MDHLELAVGEVLSAFDHVAAWHGMLRIARAALDSANQDRPDDRQIQVLVNNSDGLGHSYGSHVNFLIARRTFDNIFYRKPHYLQALASFQASLILLTGQGKVGSENGRPAVPYCISQRSDFLETLSGIPTTFARPIVNARDEALAGRRSIDDPDAPARLHVICFDSAIAHGSALFRAGPMQLFLTLMELGLVNSRLILDDPLTAIQSFSTDPTLKATAELITGEHLTALELQSAFLDDVKRHAAQGVFRGIVPRADEIISLWEDTLAKFASGDWVSLARRGIDWVLKLMAIERAMDQRSDLDWGSDEIKVMDHLYSSLGDDGLYWAYEASGFVEQLVTPERIAHFTREPPADTRAWTRAMLLRRAQEDGVTVSSVDWDTMTFKLRGRHAWPTYRTLELADPFGFTRTKAEPIFDSAEDFADLLDGLESLSSERAATSNVLSTN
jgi:proteasome accessory factor A